MPKINEIAEEYGVELKQVGDRLMAVCPFHPDTKPSMILYLETNSWFCFSENIGGDVFDFIAKAEHISKQEALRRFGESLVENIRKSFQEQPVDYNMSLNIIYSKVINRYLTENPSKLKSVLLVLEEFDNEITKEFIDSERAKWMLAKYKKKLEDV